MSVELIALFLHSMFHRISYAVLLFCVFNTFTVIAQTDSSQTQNWRKPRFFFQLDRYNSFVSNIGANISGFKTGLEFSKKYRFGIGFYNLKSDIIDSISLNAQDAANAPNHSDKVKARLNMITIPFCFEYVFFDKDPWQFSLPINLGIGETYFLYFDAEGKEKRLRDAPIVDYEVAIVGQYKILKWFGVGAGVGYRLMLLDNPAKEHSFNSPIYTVKLKFFVGEIIKSVFPPKKKKEK